MSAGKVSRTLSAVTPHSTFTKGQSEFPAVHLTYECILRERSREAVSYIYEVACSITYPARSGHLSIRVTAHNTYRNAPPREIAFTSHETGATTYLELQDKEQLEIRFVEHEGLYCKASYVAHERTISELSARGFTSSIAQVELPLEH